MENFIFCAVGLSFNHITKFPPLIKFNSMSLHMPIKILSEVIPLKYPINFHAEIKVKKKPLKNCS